jgi:DNA-binding beta-propeller fold protein YncE
MSSCAVPARRSLKGNAYVKRFQRLVIALCGPFVLFGVLLVADFAVSRTAIADESQAVGVPTPTGKMITPTVAKGAIFQELNPSLSAAPERRATYGAAISVSPDGRRLAILTSGFPAYFDGDGKILPEASMEYVFVFDVTGREPKQTQVLSLPNSFQGLAWAQASDRIFASGGKDDTVVEFVDDGGKFIAGRTIRLGHKACLGAKPDPYCGPTTGGLAVSPDGTLLLVANIQNDSVSLIDLATGEVAAEQDLRPGIIDPKHRGEPGGSFPRAVAWISSERAYVASARDREIISLAIAGDKVRVIRRLPVQGQPTALLANRTGSRLYVALDMTNHVEVFDTARGVLMEKFDTVAPAAVYDNRKKLGGANTNALALTPDEHTLLVSNGGQNSVAIVRLSGSAMGVTAKERSAASRSQHEDRDAAENRTRDHSTTIALVPTGWYPTGVAVSKDGATWYVVNAKSLMGPNSGWCGTVGSEYCDPKTVDKAMPWVFAGNGISQMLAKNAHVNQLEHAGFLTMPAPDALELARLTNQVAHNNRFDQPDKTQTDERLFSFLRQHIKHVIYIMKQNRTYDQVLGDLEVGNGDPRLTLFPERISPNHHAIARNFVTLDNLLLSGEGSVNGAEWTFAAQTSDMIERTDPLSLATFYKGENGGFPYGSDRSANTAYPTSKQRNEADPSHTSDPDILPGTNSVYGLDGPGGEVGAGYIWNAALRAGLSVRAYGLGTAEAFDVSPPVRDLRNGGQKEIPSGDASLVTHNDLYWPGTWIPDFWRVREWKHEFAEFVATKSAPNLMVLHLFMDHFGNFDKSVDGVNTPETQMADNDYAVGQLIEAVANSPFAKDTIVITIEDDASDGPDHVDAQRSVALFAGPYVRQHAVVSTRYTTVSVVKTIEELLGMGPTGLNDGLAAPMSDVFDPNAATWSYKSIVPDVLYSTKLPLLPATHARIARPRHSAAYWTKVMAGQDFSGPDRVDPVTFNHALWRGLKGDEPYPAATNGTDLRVNRAGSWREAKRPTATTRRRRGRFSVLT